MSNSEKALEIHKKISRLIKELDIYDFDFMYHNNVSSIRRKRHGKNVRTSKAN
jgi:hypothetical protein